MTGAEFANLVARYLVANYGAKGLRVYREVGLGKSIIGKNRRIDIFLVHDETRRPMAIECKYQESAGTVDEKIPYALDDLRAVGIPVCLAYAGDGFSEGVRHMLAATPFAALCLPDDSLRPTANTHDLDVLIATTFHWWDIVLAGKQPLASLPRG
jgi:hypothetical protein